MKKHILLASLLLSGVCASATVFAGVGSGPKLIKSNLTAIVECGYALMSAVEVGAAADGDLTQTDLTVKACHGLLNTTNDASHVDANGVITLAIVDSSDTNGISTAVGGSSFVLTPKTTALESFVSGSNTGDIHSWAVAYIENSSADLRDVNMLGTHINFFAGLPSPFGSIS